MNCRDVREAADRRLFDGSAAAPNHDLVRHLQTCASCRAEIGERERIRGALSEAFDRTSSLQPSAAFASQLRGRLRAEREPVGTRPSRMLSGRWLAIAASMVFAAGLTTLALNRSLSPADALARDAIGDHRNCALKFRLVRHPVPLEEAAQRFDSAYRLLLSAPPDDIATPDGQARVTERHACAYGAHRFGHIVMEYRGHIVSLLMPANQPAGDATDRMSQVIGRATHGLSVISVAGLPHAIVLVGDLGDQEMTELSSAVSMSLARRQADGLNAIDQLAELTAQSATFSRSQR